MNISDVINDIKLTCGLNTIALPYDKPVENVIQEILKTSIRTFSQFKPQIKECMAERKDLRSMNEADSMQGIYYIPEELTTTPVSYCDAYPVSSQKVDGNKVGVNAFSVVSPFVGFGSYYPQDIMNATMTGAAVNKFIGVTSQVPSSKWMGYNKIKLINWPKQSFILFVAKCDHELSGETIEESCRESFIRLATLDVQRTLYNQLKNMNNVGSAFKEIQLKIEDWSGAEASRNELVQNWTENFHLDDAELLTFF